MISIRRSDERGQADRGWLQARFTFSFANYHDPKHTGFRVLRVMNEDRISPGKGFGPHAHRNMEIISYILTGALSHRDSMGAEHTIGPNEIQVMSAGSGIVHSEFNESTIYPVHLIQIWIEPRKESLKPSYQQIAFSPVEKRGRLRLLAGPERERGAALINQDARLFVTELAPNQGVRHLLGPQRHGWVQIARGAATLNGYRIRQGDGVAVSDENLLITGREGADHAEVLVFDLP
jgi:redox-sensitive bicupin YhaK (pirin superfamily)